MYLTMDTNRNSSSSLAASEVDSQVSKACKQVLRLIWSRGLDCNDPLPTQRELQKMYGFSHNVLTPAMQRLARAGVVTRKVKVGTLVVDRRAFREPIWRVAIAVNFLEQHDSSPFFSLLAGYVQRELMNLGCRPRLYLRTALPAEPSDRRDSLSIYGSLGQDVRQEFLDGAISLGSIDEKEWHSFARNVPLCGFAEAAGCGAGVDQQAMAQDAVALLASKGCRRLTIISNALIPTLRRFWDGFEQGIEKAQLKRWSGELISTGGLVKEHLHSASWQIAAGQSAAKVIAAMPKRERPDGLIVVDDFTAAGLTMTLRELGDYRPRIAVLTNLQVPQVYALPVFRFQLDVDLLARRGVSVFHKRLLNPTLPAHMDWVAPRYGGEPESPFPPAGMASPSSSSESTSPQAKSTHSDT
jgi:DNA-binding LacI/PurR family transcriptional regulator